VEKAGVEKAGVEKAALHPPYSGNITGELAGWNDNCLEKNTELILFQMVLEK
jgi:hypothetical protein